MRSTTAVESCDIFTKLLTNIFFFLSSLEEILVEWVIQLGENSEEKTRGKIPSYRHWLINHPTFKYIWNCEDEELHLQQCISFVLA